MLPLRSSQALALCFAAALFGAAARADEPGVLLELGEAQMLAVTHQPLLEAQSAAIAAAREDARAASELPDPKLNAGVSDLPIEGSDRYSLQRNDFTMFTIGVTQEFPRAEKRRLLGARGEHEADVEQQMLAAGRLQVRREVALAWLDVWQPERAQALARATLREADLQVRAAGIAYTAGRSAQAGILASRVSLALLQDELSALEQAARVARSKLARWIGVDAAQRSLAPDLPRWPEPGPVDEALTLLRTHPHLDAQAKRVEMAKDGVALAEQAYKPDWGVELEYAHRPEFSDFISLSVSVDLPLFTHNRQDRGLGARLAQQAQAEQSGEDLLRQEEADLRANWQAWQGLTGRLRRFDTDILPQGQQRIDAAVAAWQAGPGTLAAVLDARRTALDNRMKQLDLLTAAARARINLLYFAGERT